MAGEEVRLDGEKTPKSADVAFGCADVRGTRWTFTGQFGMMGGRKEAGRMTFAEKLMRLRKREGLSQEALAEALGVSRQAVSRWEQGTALPDAAKLLPCARLFRVSVEWLLDPNQDWEERTEAGDSTGEKTNAAAKRNWIWYLSGGIVTGLGALGMVVMGILSSVYPVVLMESPAGVPWTRV